MTLVFHAFRSFLKFLQIFLAYKRLPVLWRSCFNILFNNNTKKLLTEYSHKNVIDEKTGFYSVNCSGFINHLLAENYRNALEEIRLFIRETSDYQGYKNGNPRTLQYIRFLNSTKPKKYWLPFRDARLLKPGDLLAYAKEIRKVTDSGQHIMVVAGTPSHTTKTNWIEVPIVDSTTEGHGSKDIRSLKGGIGTGSISLGINNVGNPIKIKWSPESKNTIDNPHVVMARLT